MAIELLADELISINSKINSDPKNSILHCDLGNALVKLNRYEEAIESYAKALELDPNYFEAYSNQGVALKSIKKYDEALKNYNKAISINPNHADAYSNKGVLLSKLKRYEEAVDCCNKAITINPGFGGAYYNRGIALQGLKRYQEALDSYAEAIKIDTKNAQAHCNTGVVYHELEKPLEAITHYDRAIAADETYASPYWNKANSLLLAGDYEKGLPLYEWRWTPELTSSTIRNFKQPLWLGKENLAGKTILLHCEQGAGDSIQCIRYAALVKNMANKVIVEAPQSLVRLFEKVKGIDQIVATGTLLPEFDFHCPLMSLPFAFKTTLQTIPVDNAYLYSDHNLKRIWAKRLGPKTRKRVGLVWSGSKNHGNDHKRSLRVASLIKYLPDEFEYICLQKEVRDEDVESLNDSNVRNFKDEIKDFADTAALCDLMDLIITVDTSVAHLSCGLGKETWVLLYSSPDWRWLLKRSDSPWYPTAELIRQNVNENWDSALSKVSEKLMNFNENLSNSSLEHRGENISADAINCFYINLDSEIRRRNRIEKNFNQHKLAGWNLSRVSAFSKDSLEVASATGKIRSIEKGCFLSHKSIVEQSKHMHAPIMILEDDAEFGAKSCEAIKAFMEKWGSKNEWDILFTDITIQQPEKLVELFILKKKLQVKNQHKVINLKNVVFAGATSYVLSESGIRKLNHALTESEQLDRPFDLFVRDLIWAGTLTGVVLFPFVTTLSSESENSQIQLYDTAQTDLIWNAFRKLMWVESDIKN